MLILLALALGGVAFAYYYMNQKQELSTRTSGSTLACPSCGTFTSSNAAAGAIVRCEACSTYSQVEPTGLLGPIPAEHVAQTHVFQAYMPETVRWPNVCCVCCEPATRTEKLSLQYKVDAEFEDKLTASLAVATLSVGTMQLESLTQRVTETINVPHCAAHSGGARMVVGGIHLRSFRYYQLFVQLNRATFGV